ncbi:MAG: hypothetical protein VYE64_06550, partial [Planctomycetota bacterium]|nr:hypothetical protein [Planctomycetota bacterium]
ISQLKTRLIDGQPHLEVPPGSWRIEGHYWPVSFVRGAVTSLIGWCIWLACIVLLAVRERKAD